MNEILDFLKELKTNNNRDWFNANKERYEAAKKEFENICSSLILKFGEFDEKILNVSVQECIFRIFRDIRFSSDKTPYKTHFGAYVAFPGGRKSTRAGYYLHLDPAKGCFFSAGIWCPQPNVLKALRESIFENYDELREIRNESKFEKEYGSSFYQEDKLKTLPKGFSADFPEPELLKLKHYLVSHNLTEKELLDENFIENTAYLAKTAYPFNQFLNFTVDELTA